MRQFLITITSTDAPDLFFEFDDIDYALYAFTNLLSALNLTRLCSMRVSRISQQTGWYDEPIKTLILQNK